MIITKKQLIDDHLKGYKLDEVSLKILFKQMYRMSEIEFIETIGRELNYKLEPIRTNTYLVNLSYVPNNHQAYGDFIINTIIPKASINYLQELMEQYEYPNDNVERNIYQAAKKQIEENSKT
jgi:hypothetical protein